MLIKGITDEDFVNYKVPSMYIATATCSFKCDQEYGSQICQNGELAKQPTHNISDALIAKRYLNNDITRAVVFGGLEPFDQFNDMCSLIKILRVGYFIPDDIVIYTGYNRDEIEDKVDFLIKNYSNVIIKFGRYIPGQKPHYDPVLGVYLASDNQYAEKIS